MGEVPPAPPKIIYNDDGSTEISIGKNTLFIHKDGSKTIRAEKINKIGIENIVDLYSYAVNKKYDLTIHQFSFNNGGTCEIAYDKLGNIKIFKLEGCRVSLNKNGDISISENKTTIQDSKNSQKNTIN